MTKLTLKANPTFSASVGVPVAGGDDVPVVLTFKHRTKSQLAEFLKDPEKLNDLDAFMSMVEAWELPDALTRENVEVFLDNYPGAGLAVFEAYIGELTKARAKN